MTQLKSSVLEAIGETPLVELNRLARALQLDGRILAKLEFLNPGYSKKDRVALQIIEDAEADGLLKPGQTVVELTSGNTGTGLAIVCGVKGYPFVAVISEGNSIERVRMMKALGAEVVRVPQAPGSIPGQVSSSDLALVEQRAQELTCERGAFRVDQFKRAGSARAHELHTAQEIWRQTDGRFDAFCDFLGTGGSFAGCAAAFRRLDPRIQCYVVEPSSAAILGTERVENENHRIQGGGYAMSAADLPLVRSELIDGFLSVTDEEAMETARLLARQEGLFAGFSAGANVAAAAQLLRTTARGATIVVLLCDSGLKYLSTDLWEGL